MISYKVIDVCQGWTISAYEIHVFFNSVIICCINYIEDPIKSSLPQIKVCKYIDYYQPLVPKLNYLNIAQNAIAEHFLL